MEKNSVRVHMLLPLWYQHDCFFIPNCLYFWGKKGILLPASCRIVLYDVPELSPYNPMHFSRGPTVPDPLTQCRRKKICVGIGQAWFQILVLLLTDCVTLGQLQNLSRLCFLSCKRAVVTSVPPTPAPSKHCCEPEMENPWQKA